MFEARTIVQTALSECETARRARDGDALALARTHQDAGQPPPRLIAFIRGRLAAAMHLGGAERASGARRPVIAAPRLA